MSSKLFLPNSFTNMHARMYEITTLTFPIIVVNMRDIVTRPNDEIRIRDETLGFSQGIDN